MNILSRTFGQLKKCAKKKESERSFNVDGGENRKVASLSFTVRHAVIKVCPIAIKIHLPPAATGRFELIAKT